MIVSTKRVYDTVSEEDGARILVDRLWPRGVKKTEVKIDYWAKELSPSTELRKWFGHDPKKWDKFRAKYYSELGAKLEDVIKILKLSRNDRITFVYSAKDVDHNQAVALKSFVERLLTHIK